jgi:hypothetical protein
VIGRRSLGVLKKLRLYLATKEQKLYFTAADAPAATTATPQQQ